MSSISDIDICNNALVKLGRSRITGFDDETEEAIACNLIYEMTRDDVLADHPWNFAITEDSLQVLEGTPLIDFTYKHQLPSDCLRVVRAIHNRCQIKHYKVKGRELHADYSPVGIEYIKRVTDATTFSPQFADTLATRLCGELAGTLTGGKGQEYFDLYDYKLKKAKKSDGQEGSPNKLRFNTWVDSRI